MPVRPTRLPRSIAVLAATAALASIGARAARAELPTLYVNYAMNCTFTITNDSGSPVTSIPPGDYQVEVNTPTEFASVDLVGISDDTACRGSVEFQLTGPGVDLSTTLEDGDGNFALLTATFAPSSTYTAVDNTQPSVADVGFTTTASGSPVSPAAPADPTATQPSGGQGSASGPVGTATRGVAPFQGTLEASVSAAGKLALTFKGRKVSTLVAGRYTIAVSDRSKKTAFIIQQLNEPALTLARAGFVGRRSVTVDLPAGQWFFYPAFVGRKSYFVVIK